jgi:hypothetical protein
MACPPRRTPDRVEPRLALPEVGRVEALGEPAVDRHERGGCSGWNFVAARQVSINRRIDVRRR